MGMNDRKRNKQGQKLEGQTLEEVSVMARMIRGL
jgi:hypothetical protein